MMMINFKKLIWLIKDKNKSEKDKENNSKMWKNIMLRLGKYY